MRSADPIVAVVFDYQHAVAQCLEPFQGAQYNGVVAWVKNLSSVRAIQDVTERSRGLEPNWAARRMR